MWKRILTRDLAIASRLPFVLLSISRSHCKLLVISLLEHEYAPDIFSISNSTKEIEKSSWRKCFSIARTAVTDLNTNWSWKEESTAKSRSVLTEACSLTNFSENCIIKNNLTQRNDDFLKIRLQKSLDDNQQWASSSQNFLK